MLSAEGDRERHSRVMITGHGCFEIDDHEVLGGMAQVFHDIRVERVDINVVV